MATFTADARAARHSVAQLGSVVRAGLARAVPLAGNVAFAAVLARRGGAAALGLAGTAQLVVRVAGEARAGGWPTALVAESTSLSRAQTLGLARSRLRFTPRYLGVAAVLALAAGAVLAAGVDAGAVALVVATGVAIEAYRVIRVVSGAAVATGRPEIAASADLGLGSAVAAVALLAVPLGAADTVSAAAWAAGLFALALGAVAVGLAVTVGLPAVGSESLVTRRSTASGRRFIAVNAMLGPATTMLVPFVVAWRGGAEAAGALVGAMRLGIAGPVVLSILAPVFLRRLADLDRRRRLRALLEAQVMGLLILAPYAALCLALPATLMGLLGAELAQHGTLLRLVIAGQLINVATGPTDQVLNISGGHRVDTASQLVSLVGVGVALLILPGTATAAAAALLGGLAVRNAAAAYWVWCR
jgi:hypothetical protein